MCGLLWTIVVCLVILFIATVVALSPAPGRRDSEE